MFNKEKKEGTSTFTGTSATLISAGTVLQGDLQSDTDLRIDGTIHGNVSSGAKIIVGPSGFVEGHIKGLQADVSGRVAGNITVNELAQLRAKSNVQGNISAGSLQVEAGAFFNGQSTMVPPTAVVKMNEEELLHAAAN
ncbi:MAG TPA: polymer-forming cytoskeletal protein [Flavisolibacter sp.]|jgi:cytoskeletal protein CcmA (bactofilin family)|nr:polymer-forming cytoskeletal protein [Flavisolibacter sp.]